MGDSSEPPSPQRPENQASPREAELPDGKADARTPPGREGTATTGSESRHFNSELIVSTIIIYDNELCKWKTKNYNVSDHSRNGYPLSAVPSKDLISSEINF